MLTEKEMKVEVELLSCKIEIYRKKLQPYSDMEEKFRKEINENFIKSTYSESITFTLNLKEVSRLRGIIKKWNDEIAIYQRILAGRKMEKIT